MWYIGIMVLKPTQKEPIQKRAVYPKVDKDEIFLQGNTKHLATKFMRICFSNPRGSHFLAFGNRVESNQIILSFSLHL